MFSLKYTAGDCEREILRQYKRAMKWEIDEDPMKKTVSMLVKDNLRLHKSHFNQVIQEVNDLRSSISTMKQKVQNNLDDRIPFGLMSKIRSRVETDSKVNASLEDLSARVSHMEKSLTYLLIGQMNQQTMLVSLIKDQGV